LLSPLVTSDIENRRVEDGHTVESRREFKGVVSPDLKKAANPAYIKNWQYRRIASTAVGGAVGGLIGGVKGAAIGFALGGPLGAIIGGGIGIIGGTGGGAAIGFWVSSWWD
jgi:hypothetical protein